MSLIDTLEIEFEARTEKAEASLSAIAAKLNALGGDADAKGAGGKLIDALAEGIHSGSGNVLNALQTAVKLPSGLGVAEAEAAGRAMSAGFASGIRAGGGGILAAVEQVVSAAVARMRSLLEIRSPSRVTARLGGYFGEGFAEGIGDALPMAQDSARMLSDAAVGALSGTNVPVPNAATVAEQPVAAARESIDLTVPLYVDGIKLGEAAIRGINRVTRQTGRIQLEL